MNKQNNPYRPLKKFLTKTGQEDILLLRNYVEIDYWKELDMKIDAFIKKVLNTNQSEILSLIGEWGKGKSSLLSIIKARAQDKIGVIIIRNAKELVLYYEKLIQSKEIEYPTIKALIAYVLKKDLSQEMKLDQLIREFREKVLHEIIIFCLDQFEDIITVLDTKKHDVVLRFLEGLWNYTNESLSFRERYNIIFHFVITFTPEAYERYKQMEKEKIGKYLRRIAETPLPIRELNRKEAHLFLYGYLLYLFERKEHIHKIKLDVPFIFDAIYVAGRGIPGYMQNILESLITKLQDYYDKHGKIDPPLFPRILALALISVQYVEAGIKTELFDLDWYNRFLDYFKDVLRSRESGERIKKLSDVLAIVMLAPYGVTRYEIEYILEEDISDVFDIITSFNDAIRYPIYRFKVLKDEESQRFIKRINDLLEDFRIKSEKYLYDFVLLMRRDYLDELSLIVPCNKDSFEEFLNMLSKHSDVWNEFIVGYKDRLFGIFKEYFNSCDALKIHNELFDILFPSTNPLISIIKDRTYAIQIWRDASKKIINAEVDPISLGRAALQILFYEDIIKRFEELADKNINGSYIKRNVPYHPKETFDVPFAAISVLSDKKLEIDEFQNKFRDLIYSVPVILLFTKSELKPKAERLAKYLDNQVFVVPIILSIKDLIILYALYMALSENKTVDMNQYIERLELLRKAVKSPIPIDNFWRILIDRAFERGGLVFKISEKTKKALGFYDIFLLYPKNMATIEDAFSYTAYKIRRLSFLKVEEIAGGIDLEDIGAPERDKLVNELLGLGLLKKVGENYRIVMSPYEQRVLRILENNKGEIDITRLVKAFIINNLEDTTDFKDFVRLTLARKGFIDIKKNENKITLLKLEELRSQVNSKMRWLDDYQKMKSRSRENEEDEPLLIYHLIGATQKAPKFSTFSNFVDIIKTRHFLLSSAFEEEDKRRLLSAIIRIFQMLESNRPLYEEGIKRVNNKLSTLQSKISSIYDEISDIHVFLSNIGFDKNLDMINNVAELKNFLERESFFSFARNIIGSIRDVYFGDKYKFYMRKGEKDVEEFSLIVKNILEQHAPSFLLTLEEFSIYEVFPVTNIAKMKKIRLTDEKTLRYLDKAHYYNILYFILESIEKYIARIESKLGQLFSLSRKLKKILQKQRIGDTGINNFIADNINAIKDKLSRILSLSKDEIKIYPLELQKLRLDIQDIYKILDKLNEILYKYSRIREKLRRRGITRIYKDYQEINDLVDVANSILRLSEKNNIVMNESDKELLNTLLIKINEFRNIVDSLRQELTQGVTIDILEERLFQLIQAHDNLKHYRREIDEKNIFNRYREEFYRRRKEIERLVSDIKDIINELRKVAIDDPLDQKVITDSENVLAEVETSIKSGVDLVSVERKLDKTVKQLRELERKYLSSVDAIIRDSLRRLLSNNNYIDFDSYLEVVKQRLIDRNIRDVDPQDLKLRILEFLLDQIEKRKIRLKICSYNSYC